MFENLDPKLAEELQRVIQPIMERYLKEISSTTAYDAADRAEQFYQHKRAEELRKAGDAKREEERSAEYDELLQILAEFEENGKKFYVAYYVPAQMKVLVYINDNTKCAVARIRKDELVNITRPEIITDIALMFNKRKPVTGNAVVSIARALGHSRLSAQKCIKIINNAAGSNLSYNYLNAEAGKREVNLTDGKFKFLSGRPIGDYKLAVCEYVPTDDEIAKKEEAQNEIYTIYYAMVGHPDESFMIRLKTVEKTVQVEGPVQMSAPYRVMKRNGAIDGCAVPTSKTSDISKIYEFFTKHNVVEPGYNRPLSGLIISFFNTQLKNGFLTMDNIRKGFDKKYKQDDLADGVVRTDAQEDGGESLDNMIDL